MLVIPSKARNLKRFKPVSLRCLILRHDKHTFFEWAIIKRSSVSGSLLLLVIPSSARNQQREEPAARGTSSARNQQREESQTLQTGISEFPSFFVGQPKSSA